jgi:hypothetical protein
LTDHAQARILGRIATVEYLHVCDSAFANEGANTSAADSFTSAVHEEARR